MAPLNLWENLEEDATYWDGKLEGVGTYVLNIEPPPLPSQGSIGLPLAPNRRVCVPQPAAIIFIDDDDDVSFTGSSYVINDIENNAALPPRIAIGPDSTVETIS